MVISPQLLEHRSNSLPCIISEIQAHLPASELISLRDVWVDHQGAAEGRREGPATIVRKLRPLYGYDGLSGPIKLFCLHKTKDMETLIITVLLFTLLNSIASVWFSKLCVAAL